jgi:hypothetical protein
VSDSKRVAEWEPCEWRDRWLALCRKVDRLETHSETSELTPEYLALIGAEENADMSASDFGYELHSPDWYRMALSSYEVERD